MKRPPHLIEAKAPAGRTHSKPFAMAHDTARRRLECAEFPPVFWPGVITKGILVFPFLTGCGDHFQSALDPAGPGAAEIARVWWFMFAVCAAVFVWVLLFLGLAVLRKPRQPSPPGGDAKFVVITGIVIPAIILVALLFYSLTATATLKGPDNALTIQVTGHQWWWDIRYPQEDIVTANEIYIPVGEPVRLQLTAADVIHSFWAPNLHGKMDLIPAHTNTFWIQADRPGTFRGQCAEYCGLQHTWMAFMVVALPRHQFDAWLAERQRPVATPMTPRLQRGQRAFFTGACHTCHAIRGTDAAGLAGPDLTHVGSRLTLGAATLPNTRGTLTDWIVKPQTIKPGNKMPATEFEPGELEALVDYLESLK